MIRKRHFLWAALSVSIALALPSCSEDILDQQELTQEIRTGQIPAEHLSALLNMGYDISSVEIFQDSIYLVGGEVMIDVSYIEEILPKTRQYIYGADRMITDSKVQQNIKVFINPDIKSYVPIAQIEAAMGEWNMLRDNRGSNLRFLRVDKINEAQIIFDLDPSSMSRGKVLTVSTIPKNKQPGRDILINTNFNYLTQSQDNIHFNDSQYKRTIVRAIGHCVGIAPSDDMEITELGQNKKPEWDTGPTIESGGDPNSVMNRKGDNWKKEWGTGFTDSDKRLIGYWYKYKEIETETKPPIGPTSVYVLSDHVFQYNSNIGYKAVWVTLQNYEAQTPDITKIYNVTIPNNVNVKAKAKKAIIIEPGDLTKDGSRTIIEAGTETILSIGKYTLKDG